jgi:hypothetical protein
MTSHPWFERSTEAVLRSAFRVDTQVPNATPAQIAALPRVDCSWLEADAAERARPQWQRGSVGSSDYDVRKATDGARL